jgi:hypothetical protein
MSLQFLAPAGVEPARDKKERDDGEVDEISHRFCFQIASPGSADVSSAWNCPSQGNEPAGRQRSQEVEEWWRYRSAPV